MITKYTFPNTRPDADAPFVWKLQNDIMSVIESRLGSRDLTKRLYQPTFAEKGGPCLINTPNCDGAFAKLSPNAAGYWPTLLYELAHETVHLLNPTVGYTNWLEEGIAVAMSVDLSREMTSHAMAPPTGSTYQTALQMVTALARPYCEIGRAVRSEVGALNAATSDLLERLLPDVDVAKLKQLTEECVPR